MRDDEKMFNIGVSMFIGIVFLVAFLQVCYREQNNNLKSVRHNMAEVRHKYDIAGTDFSALSAAGVLRNFVVGVDSKAETVSFSKTVKIDDIPMVE